MISVSPSEGDIAEACQQAADMGTLRNSFTKGAGNRIGMMGELLVNRHLKGKRVGDKNYAYDIVAPNGITVDVKTARANGKPKPHYSCRVYGKESRKEHLASKCDVYYFVRCSPNLRKATIIGWLPAKKFIEKATFQPRGFIDKDDRLTYSDEFVLPISELYPATTSLTKRRCNIR